MDKSKKRFGNTLNRVITRTLRDDSQKQFTHPWIMAEMIRNLASCMVGSIYLSMGDDCDLPKAMRILAGCDGFENIFLESALLSQLSMCLAKIIKSPESFGENDEGMNDLMDIDFILQKWNECAFEVRENFQGGEEE